MYMTMRLVIHLPGSSINLVSDEIYKINSVSDFCRNELGAYHASERIDELTVDTLTEELSSKLYTLLFELDLL